MRKYHLYVWSYMHIPLCLCTSTRNYAKMTIMHNISYTTIHMHACRGIVCAHIVLQSSKRRCIGVYIYPNDQPCLHKCICRSIYKYVCSHSYAYFAFTKCQHMVIWVCMVFCFCDLSHICIYVDKQKEQAYR